MGEPERGDTNVDLFGVLGELSKHKSVDHFSRSVLFAPRLNKFDHFILLVGLSAGHNFSFD